MSPKGHEAGSDSSSLMVDLKCQVDMSEFPQAPGVRYMSLSWIIYQEHYFYGPCRETFLKTTLIFQPYFFLVSRHLVSFRTSICTNHPWYIMSPICTPSSIMLRVPNSQNPPRHPRGFLCQVTNVWPSVVGRYLCLYAYVCACTFQWKTPSNKNIHWSLEDC